jgi:hypothetical protein
MTVYKELSITASLIKRWFNEHCFRGNQTLC